MAKPKRRRAKLVCLIGCLAIVAIAGTAVWHFDLLTMRSINRLLVRIGIRKPTSTAAVQTETDVHALIASHQSEPVEVVAAPVQVATDPALRTPPPSSPGDWYTIATPSLPAAPPGHPAKQLQVVSASAGSASPAAAPPAAIAAQPPPPENPFALSTSAAPALAPIIPTAPKNAGPAIGSAPKLIQSAEFNTPPATANSAVAPLASVPKHDLPAAEPAADSRLHSIDEQIKAGEVLQAHRDLSTIYWNEPALRDAIRERIETTARMIYFSPQPHYMEPYVVQSGDQLRRIADRYKITWEYLAKLNQTEPRRLRPEQRLKVIKGPFAAVVDLGAFELTIHAHGYFVRRYRIGIGKDNSTPTGNYVVQNKVINPQYTDPHGKVIAADDPSNPLGERWIDLGDSYGIHGTIEPDSIGQAKSRGCIRMLNPDVEEVFDLLVQGSQVVIQR